MTGWMKALLIGGASAAAIAAAVYFGLPYLQQNAPAGRAALISSTSPDFTKAAYKVDASGNLVLDSSGNPVPFTGPVHPGDEIEYVLTYKPPSNGPATITDTLSANQTYVDPSIQAAGWTYTTPPYSVGNSETYSNSGVGGGGGFDLTVPAISGTSGTQNGGGDGFEPVPILTSAGVKVFGINHHQPYLPLSQTPQVMCWFGASLAPCSSAYPQNSSPGSDRRATADFPHAVIYQKKIYFPSGRYDDVAYGTLELGLGCWDAEADAACPFVSLPGSPTLNIGSFSNANSFYLGTNLDDYLAGLRADPLNPTHAYVYAMGMIYCVDLAASGMPACTGWNAPTITPTGTAHARGTDLFSDENGTHLFFSNSVGGQGTVRCFNISDGSTCAGWPATGVTGGATTATVLGPGLDSNGLMKAVCFSQGFVSPANFRCFDSNNGTNITGAAAPSWPNPGFLASAAIIAPYHIPSTKKVLFPGYSGGSKCYDFGTGSGCLGYTPYWTSMFGATRDYGYAVDPVAGQDCMYGLGDGGILVRFKQDGSSATKECLPKTFTGTYNLDGQFCAKKPKQATWTNLDITNRPSELVGGTVVVKDSTGTVLQTITVTAANTYALNLSANGANGTLTVEFTPNYGSNSPPSTDYQIRLEYTADVDPQICYRAEVQDADCASSEVSNKAVYHDADGDKEADVDLGKATGGKLCPSPSCLHLTDTITLNPDGTATLTLSGSGPPGFNAVEVDVHSNTPGVTVAPPRRTFPPGPFNGTWVLTGVTPGQSVDLQIDAVDPGAGTNGADKCCTSMITVVVPPGGQHQHTDIAINKTAIAESQGPANGSGYIYTLAVTNMSDPLNGQNVIVVTDVVPAGLNFANASGTDWNCIGPFPIAAGGTLTCTYTGSGLLATGQALPPITVTSTNAVPGAQLPAITNCAHVALAAASGRTDYDPTNDQSCVTNGTGVGSLTIIKVVNPAQGHDDSSAVFQVNAICTPPGGSASTSTFSFGGSNGYQHTIPNLASGTTCSITEQTPLPPPPGDPINCHWDTTYPDAQMATIGSGEVTLRVVNTENCTRGVKQAGGSGGIKVTKHVDSGGINYSMLTFRVKLACLPGSTTILRLNKSDEYQQTVSNLSGGSVCSIGELPPQLPSGVNRGCHWSTTYPSGTETTIQVGVMHNMRVSNFLECPVTQPSKCDPKSHWNGRKCIVCNDGHGWDERKNACATSLVCDTQSTRPRNGQCLCRYGSMLRRNEMSCACLKGSTLVPGLGCEVQQRAACDMVSTQSNGGKCSCRYEGMTQSAPDRCTCPQGTSLQEGRGCMAMCPDEMVRDAHGVCGCPKSSEAKDGKCVKKRSFLDNILGNVHVGVGGGGSSGPGKTKSQDSEPQHKGDDGR